MWIFLPWFFASVVDDRHRQGHLLVRFRTRKDGDEFRERFGFSDEVTETPERDYRYRISVPREAFAAALANWVVTSLDYGNFKAEAKRVGALTARIESLHRVWDVMHLEQVREARLRPTSTPTKDLDKVLVQLKVGVDGEAQPAQVKRKLRALEKAKLIRWEPLKNGWFLTDLGQKRVDDAVDRAEAEMADEAAESRLFDRERYTP